ASRQYGSWASPSTNPVKVDQIGLGSYVVHFPLIGGPGGIAHATAVSSSARWCQIADWKPVGSGQDVYVTCYLPSGAPANSTAWLPGLGQATHAGNLQATAVDPKQGARCKVSDWAPGTAGQTVVVACYNASDVPYDTEWTLSYSYQRAVHGPAFPPRSFGYLWYNGSLPALTNYNSSGATNTLGGSGAPFVVSLPSIAVPSDTAQVTAYGKSPEYCGLHTPWDRAGGTVRLYVACFGPGGAPVKTPFFAAYTSAR
ncbi:hypothetical protein ACZ90_24140, partial [Streptomyces albus subsp. albus]